MKFYQYRKWEGGVLAMLKGGTKSVEVVFMWQLEVLTILKGGRKKFPLFKRGGGGREKFYSVLSGGRKIFCPRFPHVVTPHRCNSP